MGIGQTDEEKDAIENEKENKLERIENLDEDENDLATNVEHDESNRSGVTPERDDVGVDEDEDVEVEDLENDSIGVFANGDEETLLEEILIDEYDDDNDDDVEKQKGVDDQIVDGSVAVDEEHNNVPDDILKFSSNETSRIQGHAEDRLSQILEHDADDAT